MHLYLIAILVIMNMFGTARCFSVKMARNSAPANRLTGVRFLRQIKSSVSRRTATNKDTADKSNDKEVCEALPRVSVKNTARRWNHIDVKEVEEQAKYILRLLGHEAFGVDVEFCSSRRIRELNAEWRDKDKATDVLSFPNYEFTAPEVFTRESKSMLRHDRQLGDIIIAPSYVQKQCQEDQEHYEVCMETEEGRAEFAEELASDAGCSRAMATIFTVQERIPLLLMHSLLHLLGYDHETDSEWQLMTQREDELIAKFHELRKDMHVRKDS